MFEMHHHAIRVLFRAPGGKKIYPVPLEGERDGRQSRTEHGRRYGIGTHTSLKFAQAELNAALRSSRRYGLKSRAPSPFWRKLQLLQGFGGRSGLPERAERGKVGTYCKW